MFDIEKAKFDQKKKERLWIEKNLLFEFKLQYMVYNNKFKIFLFCLIINNKLINLLVLEK